MGALLLGAIASITSYTDMYRYSIIFMILFLLIYLIQGKRSGGFAVPVHPLLSHTHIAGQDSERPEHTELQVSEDDTPTQRNK
jgi:hypothetical protein